MKHTRARGPVSNEHTKAVSRSTPEVASFSHTTCCLAAEQALATTTLRKPPLVARAMNTVGMSDRIHLLSRILSGRTKETLTYFYDELLFFPAQPAVVQVEPVSEKPKVPDLPTVPQIEEFDALHIRLHQEYVETSEDDDTVATLQKVFGKIESALKSVSDTMMERCKMKNTIVLPPYPVPSLVANAEETTEDPSEAFR